MALKTTLEDTQSRLDALLTYANSVTGAEDTSVGDAIETLANGYGSGGSDHTIEDALIDGTTIIDEYHNDRVTALPWNLRYFNVKKAYFPNVTEANNVFQNNATIEELYLPKLNTRASSILSSAAKIRVFDCGFQLNVDNGWFYNNTTLEVLILRAFKEPSRATSFGTAPLSPTGAGGYVYVPQSLMSQFEASTKWQDYANVLEFRPIEGSIYE